MTDIPSGCCHLCDGAITELRREGSWSALGGSGGFTFSGRCPACDVDYRLALPCDQSAAWRLDAPEKEELWGEVGPEELAHLSARFNRYAVLGPKWRTFVARRRTGDSIWRFMSVDGLHHGFAMIRGGQPVSRFAVLGPL